MLTAPPVDAAREGGRESRTLSLLATEVEEPPPFHVDNKGEEPGWCSRRLSETPRLPEAREEVKGSDRRPGGILETDFKETGGRSEL